MKVLNRNEPGIDPWGTSLVTDLTLWAWSISFLSSSPFAEPAFTQQFVCESLMWYSGKCLTEVLVDNAPCSFLVYLSPEKATQLVCCSWSSCRLCTWRMVSRASCSITFQGSKLRLISLYFPGSSFLKIGVTFAFL